MKRCVNAVIPMDDGSHVTVRLQLTSSHTVITDVHRSDIKRMIEEVSARRMDPQRSYRQSHQHRIARSQTASSDDAL